ncbi:hypothetical protein EXIGLDRAFT_350211 [Exidia glandulosa HHB12029]|uniref:Uncharacterized protein n=1 Tax=Exidia glandulosa HHB12029 TaxID=1314781 RepID=A0A165CDD6_EXIGL|nr:hypothetical protein EXIGLDRAFT_350211 [Exidia glandulosa HHB12029]
MPATLVDALARRTRLPWFSAGVPGPHTVKTRTVGPRARIASGERSPAQVLGYTSVRFPRSRIVRAKQNSGAKTTREDWVQKLRVWVENRKSQRVHR